MSNYNQAVSRFHSDLKSEVEAKRRELAEAEGRLSGFEQFAQALGNGKAQGQTAQGQARRGRPPGQGKKAQGQGKTQGQGKAQGQKAQGRKLQGQKAQGQKPQRVQVKAQGVRGQRERPSIRDAIGMVIGKKSMTIAQIVDSLAARNWTPVSQNPRAYISVTLSNNKDLFENVDRGVYKLRQGVSFRDQGKEWDIPDTTLGDLGVKDGDVAPNPFRD